MAKPKDCTCVSCVNACKSQPGWFRPGEAEKASELLRLPFDEFKKRLIKEYWVGVDGYVWAPRKVGVDEDKEIASWSSAFISAPCVFLKNDRCQIHAAKPFECRQAMCCDGKGPDKNIRKDIALAYQRNGVLR